MDNIRAIVALFQDWNQAQIIGLILSLGFLVGMVFAIVEAVIHRGDKR